MPLPARHFLRAMLAREQRATVRLTAQAARGMTRRTPAAKGATLADVPLLQRIFDLTRSPAPWARRRTIGATGADLTRLVAEGLLDCRDALGPVSLEPLEYRLSSTGCLFLLANDPLLAEPTPPAVTAAHPLSTFCVSPPCPLRRMPCPP
jgi:hypothetical protein